MKENEFKEKVPMIVALNESTILFNKGKYRKAIKILVSVLKTYSLIDFSTTIRGDVWFNLSVNYILTDQISKAVKAIHEYMPFTDIELSNQILIEESLTESQKEMLKTNYRFKNYSYFLESPEYRKKFELFIKEYENILKQIEKRIQRGDYVNAVDYLTPLDAIVYLKETIVYLFFDLKVNALFDLKELKVSNKTLLNLLHEIHKLFSICKTKASEIISNELENRLIKIESQIKKEQYSLAEEQLNEIISNFNEFGDDYRMEFNDILKKTNSLLDDCEEKEKSKLEMPLKKKLLDIEKSIESKKFSYVEKDLNRIIKEAEKHKLPEINTLANNLVERFKKKDFEEEQKKINEANEELKELENLINEYDLIKSFQSNNHTSATSFLQKRSEVGSKLYPFYDEVREDEELKKKIVTLVMNFYSQHINFNPFDVDVQHFAMIYNSWKKTDIKRLEDFFIKEKKRKKIIEINKRRSEVTSRKDKDESMKELREFARKKRGEITIEKSEFPLLSELYEIFNKISEINDMEIINQQLKRIAEETKELKYDVPVENMFNFLLDFSQIIPDPNISKIPGSDENEYTLKSQMGNLYFKILEKEQNKKLIYKYDFLTSTWGEKGKLFIIFDEPFSGSVILKVKNEIQEVSKTNLESQTIMNIMGTSLKTYLDLNLGKIVAKQVQTIFYEKTFDDLTMGNYRILQAKFNAMGKDINELKTRFFEVKSPLTLNSFECSECGATLNITSKEGKFIICEHCNTPFLMEWQKG